MRNPVPLLLAALACLAAAAPAAAECEAGWTQCLYEGARDIWTDGTPTYLVSGYGWHARGTYTEDKLNKLNENLWGLGYARSREYPDGVTKTLYAMVIEDSDRTAQFNIGYEWQKYWGSRSSLQGGAGFTATIVQRPDIANGIPFPAAVPDFSLRFGGVTVSTIFIPKLGAGVNHGNVVYFFARFTPSEWAR